MPRVVLPRVDGPAHERTTRRAEHDTKRGRELLGRPPAGTGAEVGHYRAPESVSSVVWSLARAGRAQRRLVLLPAEVGACPSLFEPGWPGALAYHFIARRAPPVACVVYVRPPPTHGRPAPPRRCPRTVCQDVPENTKTRRYRDAHTRRRPGGGYRVWFPASLGHEQPVARTLEATPREARGRAPGRETRPTTQREAPILGLFPHLVQANSSTARGPAARLYLRAAFSLRANSLTGVAACPWRPLLPWPRGGGGPRACTRRGGW